MLYKEIVNEHFIWQVEVTNLLINCKPSIHLFTYKV